MSIAPVERPVAAATYGFVRFIGGGLAPYAAGKLVEHYNAHVPFASAPHGRARRGRAEHRAPALDAADRGEGGPSPSSTTWTASNARTPCRSPPGWATPPSVPGGAAGLLAG